MYTSDCIEVKVIFTVVKQLWAFFVTALASALAPYLPVLFHNWHMITSFCSLSAVQIYDLYLTHIISSNFILGRSFYVFQPPIGDYQWTNICGASCCNSSRINRRSFWHIFLYWPLLGGNNGASCLNTMECYNPITGGWTTLAPMIFCRSTHDVAVVHGILYAVGGNDGSSSLNSVEKYEPKSNKWTTVESMSTRRSSVGVVVADVLLVWSVWLREGGEGGSSFIY